MPSLPRRLARLAVAAILAGASLPVVTSLTSPTPAAAASSDVVVWSGGPVTSVTVTGPDVTPAFNPKITDYAVWCTDALNEVKFAVNGAAPTIQSMSEGQAAIVEAGGTQYWFRCLPRNFPRTTVERPGNPIPGWYLTDFHARTAGATGQYAVIYDTYGTPVWYSATPRGALNVRSVSGNLLAWSPSTGAVGGKPDQTMEFYDLATGNVTQMGPTDGHLDLHEFIPTRDKGWLWINSPFVSLALTTPLPRTGNTGLAYDCVLQEVDTNGNPTWQWKASEHISMDEAGDTTNSASTVPAPGVGDVYDPYHCNAVDQDPATGNYLVSMRNMNALYMIERDTGEVLWKLGGTPATSAKQYYTISGDPYGRFYAQHDGRLHADGTLSLYDNHYSFDGSIDKPSRGVTYRLDPATLTAQYVSQAVQPDNKVAPYTGSYRPSGTLGDVVGWGWAGGFSDIVGGTTQMIVRAPYVSQFNADRSYRVVKVPYNQFDISLLRATAGERSDSTENAAICRTSLDLKRAATPEMGAFVGPLVTNLRDGGCYQNTVNGAYIWSPSTGMWTSTTGPIRQRWAELSYEEGPLGYPITDPTCGLAQSGCYQHFQNGSIYATTATGAHDISGAIRNAFAGQGYESGKLGYPTGNPTCSGGICTQTFQGGMIVNSPAGGARIVWGDMLTVYRSRGLTTGVLGYPTSDRVCGLVPEGCYQNFSGGAILSSPKAGTHDSYGPIREVWRSSGFETGRLGYPISDVTCGLAAGGCSQTYQGGIVYYSPAAGTHASYGEIRARYGQLGFHNGRLGYPTSDIVCGLVRGGCYQDYQGGSILFSPASGAHDNYGAIRALYRSQGFETGWLGYPTGDEACGLPGGGCVQDYQGGAVYWSGGTGAHTTFGAILDAYRASGGPGGTLGYPTSDVVCGLTGGGCYQNYTGGAILWSPATGTALSYGPIRDYWAQTEYETGRFGYPTAGVVCAAGGSPCTQTYQGGTITWTRDGGARG